LRPIDKGPPRPALFSCDHNITPKLPIYTHICYF
jgi:hypothetical protein